MSDDDVRKGVGVVTAVLIMMLSVVAVFVIAASWSEIPSSSTATATLSISPTLLSLLPYVAAIIVVASVNAVIITWLS
ncbi:MAG TPA: hypothetical protein ENF26_03425 [Methanomicrobia archaeon]|nr:hypothetical protein [Methanomicrobia archaeon]HEX59181.1 hypothetical protein [Methanomicrobia archaeon]